MSVLKRGIVKSYSAPTHKASVQIAGSLTVWLDAIPVATDIAAAEVIVGRECAVLFFTDDNPDDAVVITVHGAVPGAPPSPTSIKDADGNTRVETEQSPNEDIIRMTIAGTERYTMQGVTPQHYAIGDVQLSRRFSVNDVVPDNKILGLFREASVPKGFIALCADLGGTTGAPGNTIQIGVAGRSWIRDTQCLNSYGLDYQAGSALVGHALTETDTLRVQITHLLANNAYTVTRAASLHARSPSIDALCTITTLRGLWIEPILNGDNRRPITEEGVGGLTADAHGNRLRSNTQLGSLTGAFGGGDGVLGIANATVVPSTTPAAGLVLFAEAGHLKAKLSTGVKARLSVVPLAFTAVNGNNNDIAIGEAGFVRITGPTGVFTITGVAGGEDCRVVYLYNTTNFAMTIANEDANSAAANRIKTLTGAGVGTTGDGLATLIYDATAARWILCAVQGL